MASACPIFVHRATLATMNIKPGSSVIHRASGFKGTVISRQESSPTQQYGFPHPGTLVIAVLADDGEVRHFAVNKLELVPIGD